MNKKSKILFCILAFFSIPLLADSSLAKLSQDSYWLQLGHYRTAVTSDWKSEVDESSFFIATQGKTNPKAELLATIDAFNGKN